MSDHSESSFANSGVRLMQILIQMSVIGLYYVGETMQEVSHSDDDVVFDY